MSKSRPPRPTSLEVDPDRIPVVLKSREQWICWGYRWKADREEWAKVPLDATSGGHASPTDPDTWASFDDAVAYHDREDTDTDGLGFVFTASDGVIGVDLDDCRDPETGHPDEWAVDVVNRLDSFTEISPSGTGYHVYATGSLPEGGNRKGKVEMYDDARYFTVTGQHVDITPLTVEGRQEAIDDVHAEYIADDEAAHGGMGGFTTAGASAASDLTDEELIEKAKGADNGEKFRRLWSGNVSGYKSHSEARQALANLLAFWTGGDETRMLRLFCRSRLYRDEDDRRTFKNYEIPTALDGRTEFYDPGQNTTPSPDPDPGGDESPTWEGVKALFESDENGTTTSAYNQAAELICRNYDFIKIRESGGFYYYDADEGYYRRKGDTYLEEILNENLGRCANENRRREIRRKVEGENYLDNDEFHPPEGKVNVENGVLNLDTRELGPHSPECYFTSQVRAEWPRGGDLDPEAVQRWRDALEDATDDPGERKKIEEFVGYALEAWHHDREKNMFLVGPRLSGKSTVQEAIENLFGTQPTVTNLTPQQIADTKFDAAALREAALNTKNDINARKIEDTGTLKAVFSGERMKLENKYEDRHFAAPKAKHLFTANWLPRLVGQDDAVYRRILIVEFVNTIEDHEKDRDYKKRLKTDDVRQVILKRAVDARDRLHEQDGFTNDRSPDETRKAWDSWRDGHKRFLYTQFEITGDPDDVVDKRSYWQAYREYATRKGYELKSNRAITDSLQWVPEVYTNGEGDEYGGLKWYDYDAAEGVPSDGDKSAADDDDRRQDTLPTQDKRYDTVRSVVKDLAADDMAHRDVVIEAAAEKGMTTDDVEHIVEKLLRSGDLYEPQEGALSHV